MPTSLEIIEQKLAYLSNVFDGINDAIFIDDANTGQIIDVNETTCRLYGYSREELLRTPIGDLSEGVSPYSQAEVIIHLNAARAGTPQILDWHAKRRDGTLFWVEVNIRYAVIEGNERFIVAVRDISERKRIEKERIELERQLMEARKLESLGVMAGGIAHDFNNLLQTIQGNIEFALRFVSDPRSQSECLKQALTASHRAAGLTAQMLAYSGKGRFFARDLNLSAQVREYLPLIESVIPSNLTLSLRLSSDLPNIRSDPSQIQQILMNLLNNAAEAISEASGTLTISTFSRFFSAADLQECEVPDIPEPGVFVVLEIADTGCGIAEDVQQKIFEPFFSTKSIGRGLGLAAVHGIIRSNRGALFISTSAGKGTRVQILFPSATPPQEAPLPRPAKHPATVTENRPHGAGIVLVVDDEPLIRTMTAGIFQHFGFQTLTASDGEEALEIFRRDKDRIVCTILDLTMPKLDGVQTLKGLRTIAANAKVILSSGYSESEAARQLGAEHPDGFIQKPYEIDQMKATLFRVINTTDKPANGSIR